MTMEPNRRYVLALMGVADTEFYQRLVKRLFRVLEERDRIIWFQLLAAILLIETLHRPRSVRWIEWGLSIVFSPVSNRWAFTRGPYQLKGASWQFSEATLQAIAFLEKRGCTGAPEHANRRAVARVWYGTDLASSQSIIDYPTALGYAVRINEVS
jgi:hypothetical protein